MISTVENGDRNHNHQTEKNCTNQTNYKRKIDIQSLNKSNIPLTKKQSNCHKTTTKSKLKTSKTTTKDSID
jgi:hypothetical protein